MRVCVCVCALFVCLCVRVCTRVAPSASCRFGSFPHAVARNTSRPGNACASHAHYMWILSVGPWATALMQSLESRPKAGGGGGGGGGGGLDLGRMGKAARSDAPQPRGRARSPMGRVEAAPAARRRLTCKTPPPSAVATAPNTFATASSPAAPVSNAVAAVPNAVATVPSKGATLLDAAATMSNAGETVSAEAAAVPHADARGLHGNLLDKLEAAEGAGEPAATVSSIPFVASPDVRSSEEFPCWSEASGEESVLRCLAKGVVADLPDENLARLLANMQNQQEAASAGRQLRVGSIYTGSDLAKHAWDEFLFALLGQGARCLQTEHTMGGRSCRVEARVHPAEPPGFAFLVRRGGAIVRTDRLLFPA